MVRVEVRGGRLDHHAGGRPGQRDPQRLGDRARDLVLDQEHVVDGAIEPLGPDVVAVGHVDQLRADPQAVAGLAHAAFEHGLNVEALADFADVDRRALELERRGPRHHRQALDARQRTDQLLRHAVAEVLLIRVVGEVGEREHGDRRQRVIGGVVSAIPLISARRSLSRSVTR